MSRRPARRATVATRRGGRTVRAERGDRSASTAARSRRAPAGPGCGRPRGDDPELEPAAQEDRLGRWAMSPTLINVSTRRFGRAVRLPEGDVPAPPGSRVFEVGGLAEVCGVVGGAAGRLHGCRSVSAPPSVEIDALHLGDDLGLVDAIGVDGRQQASAGAGGRSDRERPLSGRAARVQHGLNRCVPRLFIVDGAKALSKGALDADNAEKLIRNLARRLDQQWPGVAATILQGLEEILTVVRLKVATELHRSLASTKIAENMMGTIRRVTRNVKSWQDGLAMGRGRHDRGQQGLPTIEGA